MDVQLAILGTGSEDYHRRLQARRPDAHPDRFGLVLGFDDAPRAPDRGGERRLPDAVALRALRPQSDVLPRLRHRPRGPGDGGLADTVVDVDEDEARGNGFVFRAYEPVELLRTLRRVCDTLGTAGCGAR
jgi:hypothetical protein